MRIDVLDLRAYGPFTGTRLEFTKGTQGLHVVFGQNEAGKSSALRALEAALFGIPGQTSDDFVHGYGDLRLGMCLRGKDGSALSFVRRKANKNPLRDADDEEALSDDSLRPFLGGVDRDEFRRVFGLDPARLQAGSRGLLGSPDAADTAIVGAALGVSDLRRVGNALSAEADQLFLRAGRKPKINVAIARWKAEHQALRSSALSARAWDAARRLMEQLVDARDEAIGRERELIAHRQELKFVRRNRSRVVRLHALQEDLRVLDDVPDLDAAFSERRLAAADTERLCSAGLQTLGRRMKSERAALEGLPSEQALLDHEQTINVLHERSIVAAGARKTLERIRLEHDQAIQQRAEHVTTLGIEIGDDGVAATSPLDVQGLDIAIRSAQRRGDLDGDLVSQRAELRRVEREIEQELAPLPGFDGSVDELASVPIMGKEELAAFRTRFADLEAEADAARVALRALDQRDRDLTGRVDRLSESGRVPSEGDLSTVRERRDAQWHLVRRAWIDGEQVDAEARTLDEQRDLPDAFEYSLAQGDETADQLRRESKRVAELVALRHEQDAAARERADLAHAEADRSARAAALDTEWADAQVRSPFDVRDPAHLQDILDRRARVLEQTRLHEPLVVRIQETETRIKQAQAELTAALVAAGQDASEGADRLQPLLERAEAHAHALEAATQSFREAEARRAARALQIRGIELDQAELEEQVSAFVTQHGIDRLAGGTALQVQTLVDLLATRKRERDALDAATKRMSSLEEEVQSAEEELRVAQQAQADLAREAGVASSDELPALERRAETKRDLRQQRQELRDELMAEGCEIVETERRVAALAETDIDAALHPLDAECARASEAAGAARDAASEQAHLFKALGQDDGTAAERREELAAIEAELASDVGAYVRLVLASRLLGKSVERYRREHEVPVLKLASEHLAGLTCGRYDKVESDFDDDGHAFFLVREVGAGGTKRVEDLSDGTRDQLHLALVLGSLEDRISSGAEPMPLVLDDVLVHFDDARAAAALAVLAAFSKRTQVLLLTHHGRIRDFAVELGAAKDVFIHSL